MAEPEGYGAVEADRCVEVGNGLFLQKRYAEAAEAYWQAIAFDRQNAGAWSNLGAAEHKRGRFEEAQLAYERCLAIAPSNAEALVNYAQLLVDLRQPRQALSAVKPLPETSELADAASLVKANAHLLLGEFLEAESAIRPVVERSPHNLEARYALAHAWYCQDRFADAELLVRPLTAAARDDTEAIALLAAALQNQGRTGEAIELVEDAVGRTSDPELSGMLLGLMQYVDGVLPEKLLEQHRRWNAAEAQPLMRKATLPPARPRSEKLRIGLLSKDFGRHPIGFLGLPVFEALNREQCALVCYSDRLVGDEFTARFRAAADEFVTTAGDSDEALAERIRGDGIDVLIDLAGHFGRRMLVFARRPAPVQLTWLGYVGTTGMDAIDFLIADRFHVAEGEERWYAEGILRMPADYACYEAPAYAPEVGPLPALIEGSVTFGSFNSPVKFSESILDAWARVLQGVPGSRLRLKYGGLHQTSTQTRLQAAFARRGIAAERILFEGFSSHVRHLSAYNRIDLALDTQPYSGGLTTCEALWMGVPVISFPGKTFAGRHATSHLMNAGFPQFVARSIEEYVELAVSWANRLDELAAIRGTLRERIRQSPLCDAARFADDFSALLERACRS